MTREELFRDLWNTASMSCDTPYKPWVRQGFNWMYGWYESEVKSLKEEIKQKNELIISLAKKAEASIDHACEECIPNGPMIKQGFQCTRHQGLEIYANRLSGKHDF